MTSGRIILPPTNPSLDANGNPVSGATLTYYENGTTTLVSIYSDAALSVPLANPLSSDAAGVFPQVWAPNDIGYSVKWSRTGLADVTFDDIFPDLDSSAVGNFITANQAQVTLGSNVNTSFGTIGVGLIENAFTQTDSTTGVGTVATAYSSVFGACTFATPLNAITITDAFGLYLKDPIAGSHVTLTNKWALGVDSLKVAGNFSVGGNLTNLAVPTRQVLTAGTAATYNTPANCRQLRIRMIGGGGGGGGKTGDTNGVSGGNTIFNSVGAAGGGAGINGAAGALGGSAGGGTGTGIWRKRGAAGNPGGKANATVITSAFGGTGGGEGGGISGTAAATNTGGGGGGAPCAGVGTETSAGPGGGQGEIVEFLISAPAASYTYTVGASGAGGTSAGAGGSGLIVVDEFY
jgi:hypothetical protein